MQPQLCSDGFHQGVLIIVGWQQSRDPGDPELLQDRRDVAELPFDRLLGAAHFRRQTPVEIGLVDFVPGPLPFEHLEILGDHDDDLLGRPIGPLGSRRCALGIH